MSPQRTPSPRPRRVEHALRSSLAVWALIAGLPTALAAPAGDVPAPPLPSAAALAAQASAASPAAAADPRVQQILATIELRAPEPGPELGLSEALAALRDLSPELATLRQEEAKARARRRRARAAFVPRLGAELRYSRADHADEMDLGASMAPLFAALGLPPAQAEGEPTVVRRRDDLAGSLTLSWQLVDLRLWYAAALAERGLDLAALAVRDGQQQLELAAAKSYFAAAASRSLLELQRSQVSTAARHLAAAQRRYEVDAGLRLDVLRAQQDLALAVQGYHDALHALDTARDVLGGLLGTPGLPLPQGAPAIAAPPGDEAALLQAAGARRLDLAQQHERLRVAEGDLSLVRAGFLPTLSAAWSGSWQITEPAGLGSDDPSRWTAFLTLSVPLLDASRYADLDERRAALRQAEFSLQAARRSADQETRGAARDLAAAQQAATSARGRVTLAAEALRFAEQAYAVGVGTALELSDARQSLASAQVDLLRRDLQISVAALSLRRAVGLGVLDD